MDFLTWLAFDSYFVPAFIGACIGIYVFTLLGRWIDKWAGECD
jgi:hypothetical protein